MKKADPGKVHKPERAFLNADVLQGRLTTDVLLSLAERDVFEPRWNQLVIDDLLQNTPAGPPDDDIDKRIGWMNTVFVDAMTEASPMGLRDEMQAEDDVKYVLAGAMHSASDVLVTDDLESFDPPSSGPYSMRVEGVNQFLSRKLEDDPDRVQNGLRDLCNRSGVRTMSALIDTLVAGRQLRKFGHRLQTVVPPEGSSDHVRPNH